MAKHINREQLGETRLSNIHPKVEYLLHQDGDDDNLQDFTTNHCVSTVK